MGYLRFWRRKRILPGVTLNFGKRGVSTSIGVRGAPWAARASEQLWASPVPGSSTQRLQEGRAHPKARAVHLHRPYLQVRLLPAVRISVDVSFGCAVAGLEATVRPVLAWLVVALALAVAGQMASGEWNLLLGPIAGMLFGTAWTSLGDSFNGNPAVRC